MGTNEVGACNRVHCCLGMHLLVLGASRRSKTRKLTTLCHLFYSYRQTTREVCSIKKQISEHDKTKRGDAMLYNRIGMHKIAISVGYYCRN
jgi:hypothetical protein